MKYIKEIISKVSINTCFRSEVVWYNLIHGKFLTTIIIFGLLLCFAQEQYQNKAIILKKDLELAIWDGWKETEKGGELYLNIYMEAETFPLVFTKEDIFKMVANKVEIHNARVDCAKENREAGIYVKPDGREEHKIKAIYIEKDMNFWKTQKRVWLVSENGNFQSYDLRKELEEKGEIIPLKD